MRNQRINGKRANAPVSAAVEALTVSTMTATGERVEPQIVGNHAQTELMLDILVELRALTRILATGFNLPKDFGRA